MEIAAFLLMRSVRLVVVKKAARREEEMVLVASWSQFIFRNTTFLCSYYNVNESVGIGGFLFINQYMQPPGT